MAIAIVAGAVANKPRNGGEAWVRLSWLLGLRRLGYDAFLVERLPAGEEVHRRHFEAVVAEFELAEKATLLGAGSEALYGRSEAELAEIAAAAEVVFNISGHLQEGPLFSAPRRRVYVDLDPGFTQAWHADPGVEFEVPAHDHYVTVGLNLGRDECPIPAAGLEWIPTLPPVVLERWPVAPPPAPPLRFTTIATWRSPYGPLQIGGRTMGLKHHEFRRVIELPKEVPSARFELALDIHPGDAADLEALLRNGWEIVAPEEVGGTPGDFRSYLQGSGAEFSVAQGVYVDSRSGWFSDRTADYLASGRPALVQETGLAERMPVGEGLLTFSTPREAAEGARRICEDPVGHAEAARGIAEQHLDSDRVLARLLERIGAGA
jgi:hypothetical protein